MPSIGRIKLNKPFTYNVINERAVLVNPETHEHFSLNTSATELFCELVEHGDFDRAVANVAETYGMKREEVRADMESLLRDLLDSKILETDEVGSDRDG